MNRRAYPQEQRRRRSAAPRRLTARQRAIRRKRRIQRVLVILAGLIFLVVLFYLGMSYLNLYRGRQAHEQDLQRVGLGPEGIYATARLLPEGQIAGGIAYEDVDLSGLQFEDASTKLRAASKRKIDAMPPLPLQYKDKRYELRWEALGLSLDVEAILKEAETKSHKLFNRSDPMKEQYRLDEARFQAEVERFVASIDQPASNAKAVRFSQEALQFEFDPETTGLEVQKEQLVKELRKRVEERQFTEPIALQMIETPAGRTAEEMAQHLQKVAGASTPILSYSEGRNHNVKKAADLLSGYVLQPGEKLSYNTLMGEITEENGYKMAGVQDAEGNDTEGLGGGLCQPSTTLFQAAVKANLRIVTHNYHSTPVGYCPIGTDAMVSNWSDLVIQNPSDEYPYAISAYFDGALLRFDFYGPPNPDHAQISLKVEEINRTPPTGEPRMVKTDELAPGETKVKVPARDTRHIKLYKVFKVDDQVIRTELMYENHYFGNPGIIEIGKGRDESIPAASSLVGYYIDGNGDLQPSYAAPAP